MGRHWSRAASRVATVNSAPKMVKRSTRKSIWQVVARRWQTWSTAGCQRKVTVAVTIIAPMCGVTAAGSKMSRGCHGKPSSGRRASAWCFEIKAPGWEPWNLRCAAILPSKRWHCAWIWLPKSQRLQCFHCWWTATPASRSRMSSWSADLATSSPEETLLSRGAEASQPGVDTTRWEIGWECRLLSYGARSGENIREKRALRQAIA